MAADTLHMDRDILLQIVREKKNVFWASAIFRANVYARLKLSFTFNPKGQNTERKRKSGPLVGLGGRNTICHFLGRRDKNTLVHIQRLLLHLEGRPNWILHVNKLFSSTFQAFTTKWITTSGAVLTFEACHDWTCNIVDENIVCTSYIILQLFARMWCALLPQFQLLLFGNYQTFSGFMKSCQHRSWNVWLNLSEYTDYKRPMYEITSRTICNCYTFYLQKL